MWALRAHKTLPYFSFISNLESGFFLGALRPLKNPSLVVSDFASIEFGFFRALRAQINPFLVAFTRIIVGKFMLVGEEFFYCKGNVFFFRDKYLPLVRTGRDDDGQ